MRRVLLRVLSAVQLTRLTMAFGAVSDIWLVILLSRVIGPSDAPVALLPLPAVLFCGAVVAVGLFAFSGAMNDLLDARHDTAFSPDRPIPAGRIRPPHAIVLAVAALLAAIFGSVALGLVALLLTASVAAAILFYNAVAKHVPAIGMVTVAGIHALHMSIPNHALSFTMPLALVATHAFVLAALVHRWEDKRPPLSRRSMITATAMLLVVVGAILWIGAVRSGSILGLPSEVAPLELLWPALAVGTFAIVAHRKTRRVPRRVAAEKLLRYGAMWQCLYAVAWLAALGLHAAAIAIGVLAACGFVAMTILRELNGIGTRPLAYRV